MANSTVFLKSLATAASATNIAASQSPGTAALTLNGTAAAFRSTTASAAAAVGSFVLPVASSVGVVPGCSVTDSTTDAIPTGTTVIAVGTASVTLSKPIGGAAGVLNGDTIVFAGPATIDAVTATNVAIGRRVIITSGGNDTGITWTVVGTNSTGNRITDTFAGASGGAAQSNLDFVTVSSITPSGAVASTATAGTNGVGSSPWWVLNNDLTPMNVSFAIELVSGSVTFSIQYTYDDPNNLQAGLLVPLPFFDPVLGTGVSATTDGAYTSTGITAARLYIASGTGVVRCRFNQSGIG